MAEQQKSKQSGDEPRAATTSESSSSETTEQTRGAMTTTPGVMHTTAQSVVRDGVQVLTDRPEESDEPVGGSRQNVTWG